MFLTYVHRYTYTGSDTVYNTFVIPEVMIFPQVWNGLQGSLGVLQPVKEYNQFAKVINPQRMCAASIWSK